MTSPAADRLRRLAPVASQPHPNRIDLVEGRTRQIAVASVLADATAVPSARGDGYRPPRPRRGADPVTSRVTRSAVLAALVVVLVALIVVVVAGGRARRRAQARPRGVGRAGARVGSPSSSPAAQNVSHRPERAGDTGWERGSSPPLSAGGELLSHRSHPANAICRCVGGRVARLRSCGRVRTPGGEVGPVASRRPEPRRGGRAAGGRPSRSMLTADGRGGQSSREGWRSGRSGGPVARRSVGRAARSRGSWDGRGGERARRRGLAGRACRPARQDGLRSGAGRPVRCRGPEARGVWRRPERAVDAAARACLTDGGG